MRTASTMVSAIPVAKKATLLSLTRKVNVAIQANAAVTTFSFDCEI